MSIWRSQLASLAPLLALAFVLALGWLSWSDSVAAQQAGKGLDLSGVDLDAVNTRLRKQQADAKILDGPAEDLAIMKALDSRMKVSFKGTPMKEVLEKIEDHSKGALKIIVDEVGIKQAMVDPNLFLNEPATKEYRQPIKVRTLLRILLEETGMGYYIEDGNLWITKDAKALTKLVAKTYPVSNLVGGPDLVQAAIQELRSARPNPMNPAGAPPEPGPIGQLLGQNIDGLTNQIRGSVDPEHWGPPSGTGPGSMTFVPSTASLQVRASLEVHYLLMASGLLDNSRKVESVEQPDLKAVMVRTYNIAGLIDPKNFERSKAELLSALNLAAGKGKDGEKALSPASAVILSNAELLVVRQTLEVHQQIRRLLCQMNAARALTPAKGTPTGGTNPPTCGMPMMTPMSMPMNMPMSTPMTTPMMMPMGMPCGGTMLPANLGGITFGNNGGGGVFGSSSGVFGTPPPPAAPPLGGFLGDVK